MPNHTIFILEQFNNIQLHEQFKSSWWKNAECSNDHSLQVQVIPILVANVTDKIYGHADNLSCLVQLN